MKLLIKIIGSMKTMAVLMLIFAISIGYATFVENDYGTMTAKAEIYNALWFEILLALLSITLIINIFTYKMYTLKKAPIFLFHISFLVILVGAAITRYVGYEGTMHIREGDTSSEILSSKPYLNIILNDGKNEKTYQKSMFLSNKSKNYFNKDFKLENNNINIKLKQYIPDAIETIEFSTNGKAIAQLMITGGGQGKPVALEYGNFFDAGNYVIDFESKKSFSKPVINLFVQNDELFMSHNMILDYFTMDDRKEGKLKANEKEKFNKRTLYGTDLGKFVLKDFLVKAKKRVIQNPNSTFKTSGVSVLKFNVTINNKNKVMLVYFKKGKKAIDSTFELNGVIVSISFGSIQIPLDFSIKLLDFQLDRYPGSMSPASYASEVILVDKKQNINMPYRIYMNNILDYKNYRFFQASYDRDEKGTVLSVNHDPGTLPSYIGYFILAIGMFWSLLSSKTRFAKLKANAIKYNKQKALKSVVLTLLLLFTLSSNNLYAKEDIINTILSFDNKHAGEFGKLISQDTKGRMKPVDTLSTEIMAKVHGSHTLDVKGKTLSANQVILGMMIRPNAYKYIKLIKTNNEKINKIIGVNENSKYASFSQFFQDPVNMRGYKLSSITDAAARKAPKNRDKLDKIALKIDEKVNVVYMVYSGRLVKIWPKPNDINNKWFPTIEALRVFENNYKLEIKNIIVDYFLSIGDALKTNDWKKADENLKKISKYQIKYGSKVYPSANKIKAEIFYNHTNVFEKLYPLYFLLGFILLILSFLKILYSKFNITIYNKLAFYSLLLLFIAHTFGLILRWYISGHAPWSNGYESMIYISWATVLAGFIFSKHSPMTLASTAILTGLIVFVAHLNWMNPQVTNLVPVLNSYWLSIHVSMITASYGFLGLGALLGFINLILFIIKSKNNNTQVSLSIKELNAISEMTLMAGLFLLTVGNFLGGVWANESWGRYWGWDPKETWALVTIIVYAIVLHVRFIKSIYSEFIFTLMSLLAFTSVLMTYFGVNYYLAGMHSYAKGDPVPIPDFVPITYTILFIVIIIAYRNRKITI